MISLSSQVNWSVSMISSLYVSLLSWDVCHPQRQVAYHKYVQAASIGQSYYKTLVSFHRPMSFINWHQLHFAFLLLGLVFLTLSCLWLLKFFLSNLNIDGSYLLLYVFQCSDKLGLSLELGSFAAGVMIATTDLAQHTLEQVWLILILNFYTNLLHLMRVLTTCLFHLCQ